MSDDGHELRAGLGDADALTAAVYACLLERRLAGEPITHEQALERVKATREVVLRDVLARAEAAMGVEGAVSGSDEPTREETPDPAEIVSVAVSRYEANPQSDSGSIQEDPGEGGDKTSDATVTPVLQGMPGGVAAETPGLPEVAIDRIVDGRYRLMQVLASGGFSRVYLSERVRTHEPVVLKFLSPPSAADRRACDEHFRAEVRALGRLDHPGIAQLLDSGVYHGVYYIVMECVLGETLRSRLRRDPAPDLACRMDVLEQTCDALARAHERGVIHRDIKPENIMVETNGDGSYRARLVDFGLAMVSVFEGEGVLPEAFAGTPRYMAPEQIRREALTEASDLFSLGLVGYELLTGEHPFAAETPEAIREGILDREARDPRELVAEIPGAVAAALLRMLAKEPGDRPASADALSMSLPDDDLT
ncbi:serine/threonine-protein kinase [Mucisphaera calidilacus]|uniref:Serine/threonine-protein kinase PrkC n=1 Tax=Mucisphaera calidilacus TaxID=2527982 RepID=A0A518BTD5_9BACT|nr:serine/threonine-protein kinase [Mucisphaera calidilacus]QDU70215.1 Serine/threonine-protein kinase PrkC [Mucisphaera calidilacus]